MENDIFDSITVWVIFGLAMLIIFIAMDMMIGFVIPYYAYGCIGLWYILETTSYIGSVKGD